MRAPLKPPSLIGIALLAALTSCGHPGTCRGDYCGTLVFAAGGQPDILLPPVSVQGLARDVFQQIFLKLADIGPSMNTLGDQDFQPQLARRWEWETPTRLVFHLDPRARWQDGPPVTAADVAFTFQAYTDSQMHAESRPLLGGIASVTARDSLTAVFSFRERYPEMFYAAVYHMYILPRHLLDTVPRPRWATAAFGRAPTGDGPYRFVSWTPGQGIELAADSTFFLGRPHIRRLIWRVAGNLNNAGTMVLAGEADAVEVLVTPANITKAKADTALAIYPYAGSTYTFVRFNLRANGDRSKPHPVLADHQTRRALVLAADRPQMVQAVFGGYAKVPPGPMPQVWSWLWKTKLTPTPPDSAEAARLIHGRHLSFHL